MTGQKTRKPVYQYAVHHEPKRHCVGLLHFAEMTYFVSGVALNSTHSFTKLTKSSLTTIKSLSVSHCQHCKRKLILICQAPQKKMRMHFNRLHCRLIYSVPLSPSLSAGGVRCPHRSAGPFLQFHSIPFPRSPPKKTGWSKK